MTEDEALKRMKFPRDFRGNRKIFQIWVTRACDKSCFGCTQGSNIAGKPGMITIEQYEQAVKSMQGYPGVIAMFGGNPSLRRGTRVYTAGGIYPIEELEGNVFEVRNLYGNLSTAFCRLSGTDQELWKVTLRGGHSYYATADHEWPVMKTRDTRPTTFTTPEKIKTVDLHPGLWLPILKTNTLGFGKMGAYDDGFLAGWILGDGWICDRGEYKERRIRNDGLPDQRNKDTIGRKRKARSVGLITSERDRQVGITERLSLSLKNIGSECNWRAVSKCYELSTTSLDVDEWLDWIGLSGKQDGLPLAVWRNGSEEFRRGVIDGLFSADCHVEISHGDIARIRLQSAHYKLARDVCDLLGFYGIKTSIRKRLVTKGQFPNGKEYNKSYTSWEISISDVPSVEHFSHLVTLTHKDKQRKLDFCAIGEHRQDSRSKAIDIVSVEKTDMKEDVWDISVADDSHCFQISNCITGNCLHPDFEELCEIARAYIPYRQRGIWTNNLFGRGKVCRATFNPAMSNFNVHLDQEAAAEFRRDWPETKSMLKGLNHDCSHSPMFVAMKDLDKLPFPDGTWRENTEENRWELISNCDINQKWSAMIGVFRGELRGWFCEIAGSQSMLHQNDLNYPDTGLPVVPGWWKRPPEDFYDQVRKHCHECGAPCRGIGDLAVNGTREQVSLTHLEIYKPKQRGREVELVHSVDQLGRSVPHVTDYLANYRYQGEDNS